MKVKEIEYRDEYIVVDPDEKVRQVANKVLDGFPAVIAAIVSKAGEPLGIVYMDTFVRSCVLGGKDPKNTKISEIMDKNILKVTDGEEIELVKQKVSQIKPHGIIVVDSSDKIKGFVSPRDWAVIIGVK